MKLNLGGRTTKIPGFTSLDCEKHPNVDLVCDISNLPYKDGEVDEIYASHCLEHFHHTKTLEVLKEWNRVLKKGGIMWLAVPNFETICKLYSHQRVLNNWFRNIIWGDQIYDKAFHYTGFDIISLCEYLSDAGFSSAEQVQSFPHGIQDCSNLMTIDGIRISLNVRAVK